MKHNKIKQIIIFITIFIFYSYTPTYLGVSGYSMLAPINFIFLTILVVGVLVVLNPQAFSVLKLPIVKWIVLYLVIMLVWLLMPSSKSDLQDIKDMLLPIIFLSLILVLTSFDDDEMSVSRRAILFATLLAIFNNINEFFNPLAYYSLESGYNILGRSAGFYINSNISGEAILIGIVLSYRYVHNKFKVLFLIVAFLGILVSFSRTGIASWFLIVFLLGLVKTIDKRNILIILLTFIIGITVLLPIFISFIESNLTGVAGNLITRLDFFAAKQHFLDASEISRLAVANAAYDLFSNNPFVGSGISTIKHWAHHVSTHNMYLKLMAEYGIIGMFLYPLILFSAVVELSGKERNMIYVLIAYLLLIGFTTHNALDGYHFMITFAVLANLSHKSKLKKRYLA